MIAITPEKKKINLDLVFKDTVNTLNDYIKKELSGEQFYDVRTSGPNNNQLLTKIKEAYLEAGWEKVEVSYFKGSIILKLYQKPENLI